MWNNGKAHYLPAERYSRVYKREFATAPAPIFNKGAVWRALGRGGHEAMEGLATVVDEGQVSGAAVQQ